jgi:hypothetical protein
MTDSAYQISKLQEIFGGALLSPFFRHNPKYKTADTPRIDYNDVMDNKYVIKCDPDFPSTGSFWCSKSTTAIARYDSIEELVADGWCLD